MLTTYVVSVSIRMGHKAEVYRQYVMNIINYKMTSFIQSEVFTCPANTSKF